VSPTTLKKAYRCGPLVFCLSSCVAISSVSMSSRPTLPLVRTAAMESGGGDKGHHGCFELLTPRLKYPSKTQQSISAKKHAANVWCLSNSCFPGLKKVRGMQSMFLKTPATKQVASPVGVTPSVPTPPGSQPQPRVLAFHELFSPAPEDLRCAFLQTLCTKIIS
jgi:hypothetical protein